MGRSRQVVFMILIAVGGCSQSPSRIAAPDVDPQTAAESAIEHYDSNADGALDKGELVRCPAVLNSLSLYDQNNDDKIELDEFAARLSELYSTRIGLTQLTCRVTYQGRPLPDAKVVFEPEPYLGPAIQPAEGVTNSQGAAAMTIDPANVPEALRNRKVVRCGTYKVRITHPSVTLPAKYNTETTLGYETQLGNPFATFSLNAK